MVILAAVRWLAKAAAQRAFGLLPNQGEGLNYALQRHDKEGFFRHRQSSFPRHRYR